MEAKCCLVKWELGWAFVSISSCLKTLFPVTATLRSEPVCTHRPQLGGNFTEKGFLGDLGLNKYWLLMDREACDITTASLILSLHITEEAWEAKSPAQQCQDHQGPELCEEGERDAVVPQLLCCHP